MPNRWIGIWTNSNLFINCFNLTYISFLMSYLTCDVKFFFHYLLPNLKFNWKHTEIRKIGILVGVTILEISNSIMSNWHISFQKDLTSHWLEDTFFYTLFTVLTYIVSIFRSFILRCSSWLALTILQQEYSKWI